MSRTNKSAKGSGYEYWSKRHPGSWNLPVGKKGKRMTHRYERREAKASTEEIASNIGDLLLNLDIEDQTDPRSGSKLYDGDDTMNLWKEQYGDWKYDIWLICEDYPGSEKKYTLIYAGFNEYIPFEEHYSLDSAKAAAEAYVNCGSNQEAYNQYFRESERD